MSEEQLKDYKRRDSTRSQELLSLEDPAQDLSPTKVFASPSGDEVEPTDIPTPREEEEEGGEYEERQRSAMEPVRYPVQVMKQDDGPGELVVDGFGTWHLRVHDAYDGSGSSVACTFQFPKSSGSHDGANGHGFSSLTQSNGFV